MIFQFQFLKKHVHDACFNRQEQNRPLLALHSPLCPQISVMCLQKHRMVKQPINNLHQENHNTKIWNQPSQDYEMQFHQITFNIPTSCRSTIFLLICYQFHSQDIFCGTYQRVYQQRWVTCHITHYTRYSWHCIGFTKDSILLRYGQV